MVHKFLATSIITTGTFAYVVRLTKFNAIKTMGSVHSESPNSRELGTR